MATRKPVDKTSMLIWDAESLARAGLEVKQGSLELGEVSGYGPDVIFTLRAALGFSDGRTGRAPRAIVRLILFDESGTRLNRYDSDEEAKPSGREFPGVSSVTVRAYGDSANVTRMAAKAVAFIVTGADGPNLPMTWDPDALSDAGIVLEEAKLLAVKERLFVHIRASVAAGWTPAISYLVFDDEDDLIAEGTVELAPDPGRGGACFVGKDWLLDPPADGRITLLPRWPAPARLPLSVRVPDTPLAGFEEPVARLVLHPNGARTAVASIHVTAPPVSEPFSMLRSFPEPLLVGAWVRRASGSVVDTWRATVEAGSRGFQSLRLVMDDPDADPDDPIASVEWVVSAADT